MKLKWQIYHAVVWLRHVYILAWFVYGCEAYVDGMLTMAQARYAKEARRAALSPLRTLVSAALSSVHRCS
eukprot:6211147-Pleurochrysis_carterae.AAC.1